ncbi:MAG: DedA family protein [Parcubacteria group bacterium]|nr:DedA family protein [Parcubacteria group bacterium]
MVFETPTTKKETRPSLKEWVVRRAQGRGALFFLFLLSAAEAVFFPVPPEALLIPIVALKKKAKENVTEKHVRCSMRWIIPACVATFGSVVGGIIGFIIGAFFFDTWGTWILDMYHAHEAFNAVARVFQNNAFVAVFTAGFTPIPYKIFTLGAGVCAVSFPVFVIASIISRMVRFGLVGYVTNRLGMISGMSLPRMIAWITLGIVCIGLSLWFLFS